MLFLVGKLNFQDIVPSPTKSAKKKKVRRGSAPSGISAVNLRTKCDFPVMLLEEGKHRSPNFVCDLLTIMTGSQA